MTAGPPPEPQVVPPPQLPATRTSPEKLVQLMVTICNRLERLEGLVERQSIAIERLERRQDGVDARVVGLNDTAALHSMLIANLPGFTPIVLAMMAVAGATVVLIALGLFAARALLLH
jgi:hypothetical protein